MLGLQRWRFCSVLLCCCLWCGAARAELGEWENEVHWCQLWLQEGRAQEALARLKALPESAMEDRMVLRTLAQAYELVGNRVWARRTMQRYLERFPDDCDMRFRLAWSHLGESDYREARQVLGEQPGGEGGCPAEVGQTGRWKLLRALASVRAGEEEEASELVTEAGQEAALFAEDEVLLGKLRQAVWPLRQRPLQLGVQTETGWTSNALQGSPLDPLQNGNDWASARGEARVWGRGRWGVGAVAPSLEAELKGVGYGAEAAQDFSYFGWAVRPGVEWDFGPVWAFLGYRADSVILAGGDTYEKGAYSYFTGHRGEFEMEFPFGLTLFGGGGKRSFRQMGRTRLEADGGAGLALSLGSRTSMLAALAGRVQDAEDEAYNLVGGTALVSGTIRLWEQFSLRLGGTLLVDDYPDSAGSEAFQSPDKRSELALKARVGIWSPRLAGDLQIGFSYEWAGRYSTLDAYDYTAHSFIFGVTWRLDGDPFVPEFVSPPGHETLDYGFEQAQGAMEERLRDLLRKDEDAQRGCSCGN